MVVPKQELGNQDLDHSFDVELKQLLKSLWLTHKI